MKKAWDLVQDLPGGASKYHLDLKGLKLKLLGSLTSWLGHELIAVGIKVDVLDLISTSLRLPALLFLGSRP